jgi:hypothetical protein
MLPVYFYAYFIRCISFYAIQQVAQAGWSPVLFRVCRVLHPYLPVGSVILLF